MHGFVLWHLSRRTDDQTSERTERVGTPEPNHYQGFVQVQFMVTSGATERAGTAEISRATKMNLLFASIRNPARQLWASRVFTAVAVLTLALGIGGTTAIFTLIYAVMLRPLPVSDPARLYRVGDGDDTIAQGRHGRWGFFSFPLYERLKAATPEFEDVTAFDWGGNSLSV